MRRGIFVGWVHRAIEVSAYGTAAANNGNLIYNNVIYSRTGDRCYFQSANLGASAYDGDMFVNNICRFTGDATEIYNNNRTPGAISYNSFLKEGGNGTEAVIVWYQNGGSPYDTHRSVAYADANYAPAWANNAALAIDPQFVDVANMDFHLGRANALRGAGTHITDPNWPFPTAAGTPVDIGAFGLR